MVDHGHEGISSAGGRGGLAVTCTLAVSDWRFQKFQFQLKKPVQVEEASLVVDKMAGARALVVDGPHSSLEPRQPVVSALEASVSSCSTSPSMLVVLQGYERTSRIEGDASQQQRRVNCRVGVAAVAASLSLAMLRIVSRPLVAPCDQGWDCMLRSAEMGVPGVAKERAC